MNDNERVCRVEGCEHPADGLDNRHCQEHWEALCDAMWLEQMRAARICNLRAGIILPIEDAHFVFFLPGFLTDLYLNFLNEMPLYAKGNPP